MYICTYLLIPTYINCPQFQLGDEVKSTTNNIVGSSPSQSLPSHNSGLKSEKENCAQFREQKFFENIFVRRPIFALFFSNFSSLCLFHSSNHHNKISSQKWRTNYVC